ncbi:TPA: hypothetical protein ACVU44_005214 [Vibrio parahaemolyticus]|uniref:hypothetical protein n=1 Tax=Vibrio harveyi group TaxID=717610 RepID=UPI00142E155D|nr:MULTISPECIES: hypothetical protein [Vibrio harveyi group]MBD6969213.1 hypothetical protein [Vibrio parahaemolyticus]MBD6974167.1 hypothetical protein [Vibrio parahaemolyticus]NIY90287.1 hypothetical protein [Vibrio campbellii]NVK69879.1 hypothetical protein [Vibrio campbellii]
MKSDYDIMLLAKAKELGTSVDTVRLALAMKVLSVGDCAESSLTMLVELSAADLP